MTPDPVLFNVATNPQEGKDQIAELVKHFHDHYNTYHASDHKEMETRRMLIDPLFMALGWDVPYLNKKIAPDKREVVLEMSQESEGAVKSADYAFRYGKDTQFFVEAKKPVVRVQYDGDAAYQLRRYGWTANLALSVLTNFKQFAVYDCRPKPAHTDRVERARINLFGYEEYPDRWAEIWGVFSREAVWSNSFEHFAEVSLGKRGTNAVDAEFLKLIEVWRRDLANAFAHHNPGIGIDRLNDLVQRTIDRFIFLRMAEDRGIQPYESLKAIAVNPPRPRRGKELQGAIYQGFIDLCEDADRRFNSGLFDFSASGDRDALDRNLPDDTLRPILTNLYYPDCPYDFRLLPVEMLGSVYERFLGRVIRLTPSGKTAKVEDKPEVKKAGGVYYTPVIIVDRLVQDTVGKWLDGYGQAHPSARTPFPKHFRILDCACGSGSFLIGAYQFLLDYALRWYLAHQPESHRQVGRITPDDDSWRLTLAAKKAILTEHIFGVDIDTQAVEVTKLSLLLKLLNDEAKDSYQLDLGERLLPSLDNNVRCGNSLIDPGMYLEHKHLNDSQAAPDPDELKRVKPFDWELLFPKAMQVGGFDVIVGNPPYIRAQALQAWAPLEIEIYRRKYEAAQSGSYDIYVVFVERALRLLRKGGRVGFILPSKFFATDYGRPLRDLIARRKALHRVLDFGHAQVFAGATTYTCLLFLTAEPSLTVSYLKLDRPASVAAESLPPTLEIESNALTGDPWVFATDTESRLADKIHRNSHPLGELARIGRGSSSGADDLFVFKREGRKLYCRNGDEVEIEAGLLRTPLYATDFNRYLFAPKSGEAILFPYKVQADRYELMPEEELSRKYPEAYAYLTGQRKELEKRKQFKAWYGFSAPRNLDVHEKAQMLVPLLANKGLYAQLSGMPAKYCLMASGGFSITLTAEGSLAPEYVLGLLNSKLLFWRLHAISNIFRGGWITCTKQYVETLPIHTVDFAIRQEKASHDQIVALVNTMLTAHAQYISVRTSQERTACEEVIAKTDQAIDQLVYNLYGLNAGEIDLVEGRSDVINSAPVSATANFDET